MFKKKFLLILLVINVCFGSVLFSEDFIDSGFIDGEVVSVSSSSVSIKEYNFETDQYVTNSYVINNNTEIQGLDEIKQLKNGQMVEVEYEVLNGKKIARTINVYGSAEEVNNNAETEMIEENDY
jgi:hypothetical protein